ncbi:hypothetical protein [Moraxella cuniculi]|uniref:hypothetical protein n=1 Tax=Moraxella cuniculi TaxID=34061 RepID=UPI0009712839|nr:hypothetical protein [Moraxella cuniculi]OOS06022.1 hypothetical protein B0189_06085 [Moraxella cuniculi]
MPNYQHQQAAGQIIIKPLVNLPNKPRWFCLLWQMPLPALFDGIGSSLFGMGLVAVFVFGRAVGGCLG